MRAGSTSPWRARAALSLAAVSLAALFLTAVSPGSAARAADGPAAGTVVVTTGAEELYGAEFDTAH